MTETNINTKVTYSLSRQIDANPKINSISDLPKITSFILPKEFELLPNVSEVFELEFAFYEHKFLTKEELFRIKQMPLKHEFALD